MNTASDVPRGHASPVSDDEALELQIHTAYRAAISAGDADAAREYFACMAELIRQRSPERIAQMELERGLR